MARTNKNYEHKKNDILIRIWEVLLQYGYEKMTLPIIIKEEGISRGAFYHYFQSKEECVDEAVKLFVENAVVEIKTMDNKTLSA
ncbi:TetR/AcrR family transcriptional regulator, partial [Lysinibacillus fusiformis]|uniref:TetR/AcrR family transcriptional regulator n=1 Tax=Lysinibacillus fusiformis TaxID=28031 RepID=UPI0020BF36E8